MEVVFRVWRELTSHSNPVIRWMFIALAVVVGLYAFVIYIFWGAGIIDANEAAGMRLLGPTVAFLHLPESWAPWFTILVLEVPVLVVLGIGLRLIRNRAVRDLTDMTAHLDKTEGDIDKFMDSWDRFIGDYNKLAEQVAHLKEHHDRGTVSGEDVNKVRQKIADFVSPKRDAP